MREKLSRLIVEMVGACRRNQTCDVFVPQLVPRLSVLAQDSTATVRQAAVEAVLALHDYAFSCCQVLRVSNVHVVNVANATTLLVSPFFVF